MEGEEQEEEERRRMRVERALAEEEEMERRRVRAVRLLGTSPSSGLAAGYLAWVASGYSREFLCHALGDGVSASQWTVAAMDLATPGAWARPEVFQGVDHLGDTVAAQLVQVFEDVEGAFAVAHGFMGRASDLPQGIMAFVVQLPQCLQDAPLFDCACDDHGAHHWAWRAGRRHARLRREQQPTRARLVCSRLHQMVAREPHRS
jgi:hypothetical protein